MSSNGLHGVVSALEWKIGFMNGAPVTATVPPKYLTAEKFGSTVNANGTTMKAKQTWTLEHGDARDEDVVYLRSPYDKYLSINKNHIVACDSEEKGDDEKLVLRYDPQNSGRWSFESKVHRFCLSAEGEGIRGVETKNLTEAGWWVPCLAVHPQCNLFHTKRKAYAHLCEDEIHCDEIIPWGEDALITLETFQGKYAVRTCTNRYLTHDGSLVNSPTREALFTLEIRSGKFSGLALKDYNGHYLTAVGHKGKLESKAEKLSVEDRLFQVQDSHPQVFITASNGKKVSIRQGRDVSANQTDVEDTETFQLEYVKEAEKWRVHASEKNLEYWNEDNTAIQAAPSNTRASSLFELTYRENGRVTLKANNGKFVQTIQNGHLRATADSASTEAAQFTFTIINRPILVLRCEHGFVGTKASGAKASGPLVCKKAEYDVMTVEHNMTKDDPGNPYYAIKVKGASGAYWGFDGKGYLSTEAAAAEQWLLELSGQSKFRIKSKAGLYLVGDQSGQITGNGDITMATKWEF